MWRISIVIAFVLGGVSLDPWGGAGAQEPAATPAATSGASATPAAGREIVQAPVEFVAEITIGTDASSAASGVAVDASGTLYAIDSFKDHIQVFDRDGKPVATWGESGTGPGQFRFHEQGGGYWGDLAIGPDGNLYVLDPFNSRIQVFGSDGAFLRQWGEPGEEEGRFDAPSGITVDGAGRVYVTEFGNRRLQIFESDGQFLAAWDGSQAEGGPFQEPKDVAVDAAGIVSVTDGANARVYRFDAEGIIVDAFGEKGGQLGQVFSPWGVAVDAQGNLYIAEYGGSRVQVFAPDGTPLGIIGSVGTGPGQFLNPIYLTVSPDGLLYVADEGPRRIQVFRLLPPLAPESGTPVSE